MATNFTPRLTLTICTRNRAFILPECLESLLHQSVPANEYAVLVVDNGSEDGTARLVKALREKHANLRYVFETEVGLSRARNRGWEEARTPWVGYVDDDARVPGDFVERALWIMEHYDFDCFGGTYYAWFKYGRPDWFPEHLGNKGQLRITIGLIGDEWLSGGNLFVKTAVLRKLNGFSIPLGMSDKLGYGEEDEFQNRLLKNGFTIGYDPELYIEHCVLPYKLKLSWQLISIFKKGKFQGAWREDLKLFPTFCGLTRSVMASFFLKLPRELTLLFLRKEKKWQGSSIYVIGPVLLQSGRLFGKLGAISLKYQLNRFLFNK